MSNYIRDNSNSRASLKALKQWCSLDEQDTSQDLVLKLLLDAVKSAADNYCQQSFPDYDGELPPEVDLWILSVAARYLEQRGMGIKNITAKDLGMVDFRYDYLEFFHLIRPHHRERGFA